MNEHPILFSTEMVRANLNDRKTNTRRLTGLKKINDDPDNWICNGTYHILSNDTFEAHFEHQITKETTTVKCAYGLYGDLLWVRETWMNNPNIEHFPNEPIYYKASKSTQFKEEWSKSWNPSIHMPKAAARIWLQVEKIKVERLNEISEEDAIAEGVDFIERTSGICYMDYKLGEYIYPITAKQSFKSLFLSINGKPKPQREHGETGKILSHTAIAWDQADFDKNWSKFNGIYRDKPLKVIINPWVWVIKYKVLSTTGKPQICYKTNEPCKYDCKGLCRENM